MKSIYIIINMKKNKRRRNKSKKHENESPKEKFKNYLRTLKSMFLISTVCLLENIVIPGMKLHCIELFI